MKKKLARRVGDYLIYVATALALAAGALWYADRPDSPNSAEFIKWAGLVANTLLIFGSNIASHIRFIPLTRFWIVLAAALVVHLTAFAVLFTMIRHWSLFWFVVAYPVESVLLDRALSAKHVRA
jgi:hypothetical protein